MPKPKFVSRADADRGFDLQLVDDTGAKIDWLVKIVGADSSQYRDKLNEIQRRNIDSINRARKLVRTPEEAEADAIELTVAGTVSWRGQDAIEPFSPDAALKIYRDYAQIREQIDRAINDRANFLPQSAMS